MKTCRCLIEPTSYLNTPYPNSPFKVGEIYLYCDNEGPFALYDLNGKYLESFISPEHKGKLYFIDIQVDRDQKLNEILK